MQVHPCPSQGPNAATHWYLQLKTIIIKQASGHARGMIPGVDHSGLGQNVPFEGSTGVLS